MNESPLSKKEERFFSMLKARRKEFEPKDEILCTMVMTMHPSENGEDYYLDRAIEYAENNPEALLKDIMDYMISLRPNDDIGSVREAV